MVFHLMKLFLTDTNILDDKVTDLCPTINGMAEKYENSLTYR